MLARWTRSPVVLGAGYAAAYFGLAALGAPFRDAATAPSAIWLPTGLCLTVVLLLGARWLWFTAVLVALGVAGGGLDPTLSLALGAAKAAQLGAAVYLMRGPGGFTGTLDRVGNVVALVVGGAILGPAVGALLAAIAFTLFGGLDGELVSFLATWWLGDAMGVLFVAPVALSFVTPRYWSRTNVGLPALGVLLALLAACELGFGRLFDLTSAQPLTYVPFPVIFWAAFQYGAQGGALSSCFAAFYALSGTRAGHGPFALGPATESLLLLESFAAVMILTGLFLGAVLSERRRAVGALAVSQSRYHLASAAGRAGVWDWELDTGAMYIDPVLKKNLGYEDDEVANEMLAWVNLIHPDDLELVRAASTRHLEGEAPFFEAEHRMLHKDGSVRWFLARGEVQRDDEGRALRLSGTNVDVTRRRVMEEALAKGERTIQAQLAELEHLYDSVPIGFALTDREHRFVRINERLAAMNGHSVDDHIGRTLREMAPAVADRVEPKLKQVLESGEADLQEMELVLPGFAGTALIGRYPFHDSDGSIQGVGVVVQDITARKRAELFQAGNNRALELVAGGFSLVEVLDAIAGNLDEHTGCGSVIRLLDDGALVIASATRVPTRGHELESIEVRLEETTCGVAAFERRPASSEDVRSDPSWRTHIDSASAFDIAAFCSVPIVSSAGELLGTVGLHAAEPRASWEREITTILDSARLARVAIEHARARDALTRSESSLRESHEQIQMLARRLIAAQEEERRRVSRELHDGLNQQLAALSFEIGRLRNQVSEGSTGLEDRLVAAQLLELQRRAVTLIDEARRMSHELHPSTLEHLGLVAAVRAHCDELNDRGLPSVRCDAIQIPESLAPDQALCLFRAVQEAVSNARRHARAGTVQVTLRGDGDSLTLTVSDDGRGFDARGRSGLGLVSIEERVRALGGIFTLSSRPNEGTRLEIRLPLARATDRADLSTTVSIDSSAEGQ